MDSVMGAARGWGLQDLSKPILLAGVAAGLVDAAYFSAGAWLKGNSPAVVLKAIAAFWPKGLVAGDWGLALLGGATHFGLAILMAAAFVLLRPSLPFLRGSTLQSGLVWGAILYAVMYLVVLPLRWPSLYPRWNGWTSVLDIVVHLAVGLVIAWTVTRQLPWRAR